MSTRRTFFQQASLLGLGALSGLPAVSSPAAEIDPDLKIVDVKLLVFKDGYDKEVYVRIEANDGTVGWGECSHNGLAVTQQLILDFLRPQLLGQSPFDTERLWEQMYWVNHDLGAGGLLTHAIGGIDCALWDLKGKLLGVPVYQLIGGKLRDRARALFGY